METHLKFHEHDAHTESTPRVGCWHNLRREGVASRGTSRVRAAAYGHTHTAPTDPRLSACAAPLAPPQPPGPGPAAAATPGQRSPPGGANAAEARAAHERRVVKQAAPGTAQPAPPCRAAASRRSSATASWRGPQEASRPPGTPHRALHAPRTPRATRAPATTARTWRLVRPRPAVSRLDAVPQTLLPTSPPLRRKSPNPSPTNRGR